MEGVCDQSRVAMEAIEATTGERIDEGVILDAGMLGGFGVGWS
jgi:hypothetical protein